MINKQLKIVYLKLPVFVSLLVVVLLAWLVAQFVLATWFSNSAQLKDDLQIESVKESTPQAQVIKFSSVELFGKEAAKRQKTVVKKKLESVNLKIKLVGTIMGANPVALIEGSDKGSAFSPNEEVLTNVKLLEVHSEHLIISQSGVKKILSMEKDTLSLNSKLSKSSLPVSSSTKPNSVMKSAASSVASTKIDQEIEKKVEKQSSFLIDNPVMLSDLLVSEAVLENDVIKGFTVEPKDDKKMKSLFDYLQLKPSDIITEINGVSVVGYSKLEGLKTMLVSGTPMQLAIIREEQTKTLSVELP